jgi:hypothetical protein
MIGIQREAEEIRAVDSETQLRRVHTYIQGTEPNLVLRTSQMGVCECDAS